MRSLLTIAILGLFAGGAAGDEPGAIAREVVQVLAEGPADARADAVATLVGVRRYVALWLMEAVDRANAEKADLGTKASAIFLLGKLGCVEARDVLEAEKDFDWVPSGELHPDAGDLPRIGMVTEWALPEAGYTDSVRVKELPRELVSAGPFWTLDAALKDVYADDLPTRRAAEDAVIAWYDGVREQLQGMLSPMRSTDVSAEAEIAAIFVLGEYRARALSIDLLARAGLVDADGLCQRFPAGLEPASGASTYPALDALQKMGNRVPVSDSVWFLLMVSLRDDAKLSAADQHRVIKCLLTINEDRASKAVEDLCAELANGDHARPVWIKASRRKRALKILESWPVPVTDDGR